MRIHAFLVHHVHMASVDPWDEHTRALDNYQRTRPGSSCGRKLLQKCGRRGFRGLGAEN